MPVRDGREYRSFGAFSALEEPKGYIVEGYATTFDAPYDMGGDGYRECISSRALDSADMSDVIFQMNHAGTPLARLRNGSMSVERDQHGLLVRADLGGCEDGRRLYEAIKNGLVDRMSWAFRVADDGWTYDEATRTATIERISKVYDVSAVSLPANEDTEIHARSYLDGVIEAEQQRESLQRELDRARALARLQLKLKIGA